MSAEVTVVTRQIRVELSGQPTRIVDIVSPVSVTMKVTGGRGPAGPPGSGGGGGVSFLPEPGPVVPPGESVLWVKPVGNSYALIVRKGPDV
jgi:hypothetical protein